jgi:hypothetical protein
MAEWLKAHAWKACIGETLSRVRIPLSPPYPDCQFLDHQIGSGRGLPRRNQGIYRRDGQGRVRTLLLRVASLTGASEYGLVRTCRKWVEIDAGPEQKMKECIENSHLVIEEVLPDYSLPQGEAVQMIGCCERGYGRTRSTSIWRW